MLKVLRLLVVFFPVLFVNQGFSSQLPPNDDACSAAFITLPSPDPCPAYDLDSLSMLMDNTGATPDSLQPAFFNCQTGNNTPLASADIWYCFVATADNLDIVMQGLGSPCVTLYTYINGCKTLVPMDCAKGIAGFAAAFFKNLVPGNFYFLQFSGGNNTDVGQFTTTFYVKRSCGDCMISSVLVPTPAPVNGYYHPGDTVTFSYVVDGYKPWNQTYLHGIEPKFGSGWNLASLNTTITVVPVSQTGSWIWTTVNVPNQGSVTGYFYDGPPSPDGNPVNNKGDVGGAYSRWIFTFRIATKPSCTNAEDLSISIYNYSDNESGNGIGVRCKDDPDYSFKAVLNCCVSPEISTINESCPNSGTGTVVIKNPAVPGPYFFSIYNTNGTFISGSANSPLQTYTSAISTGDYVVYTRSGSGCLSARAFSVSSGLDLTPFQTNYACDPQCGNVAAIFGQDLTSNYSYQWSPSGQTTQFASNLCPGTYTCTVTNNSFACSDTFVVNVTGFPIDDATMFYQPTHNNVYYCQIDTTAFPEYIAQPGGTFTWDGPINGINAVTGEVVLIGTVPAGFYNIVYTTPGPCPSSSQFTIEVRFSPPIPTVSGPNSACLDQQPITLTNTNIGFWATAWDTSANATNPTVGNNYLPPVLTTAGAYFVYALNISADLCVSYPAIWPVTIHPLPFAWAGFDDTLCPSHSTTLTGSGGLSFSWSPPTGLDDPTSATPLATPTTTTTYTLTVQDANGCRNVDYVTIFLDSTLNCDIQVYNGFSPNGDLNNDVWIIEGIEAIKNNRVSIFNRWGDQVWSEREYDNRTIVWKGENQSGEELPSGTYYYIIQVEGKPTLANWVELTR